MNDFVFTLNAIMPILIPIAIGYLLKSLGFFKGDFLKNANKLVFKLFIPISLFAAIYAANVEDMDIKFVGFCALLILGIFFIGMLAVIFLVPNKKQKGVIHQALFRSNYAIIGVPLSALIVGETARASASIVAAVAVPMFNILAVIVLSIYDHEDGEKVSIKSILYKIVTNPLIIGVFCGLVVLGIRQIITACGGNAYIDRNSNFFIQKTISMLAGVATPLALIVLGGQFEFSAVKKLWKQIVFSVGARLVLVPVSTLLIAYAVGYRGAIEFAILIALFGTPVAVSSAPMASQMGQDEELANQLVVWTSIGSALSLFAMILTLRMIGIF